MKSIIRYLIDYWKQLDKRVFSLVTAFTAFIIYLNYNYGIDEFIRSKNNFYLEWLLWFLVFSVAFTIPYLLDINFTGKNYLRHKGFIFLLAFAPILFALKLSLNFNFTFSHVPSLNVFWNYVLFWPLMLGLIGGLIFIYWKWRDNDQPFYGLKTKNISFKPYFILLLMMVPVVAAASTQPDFLEVYPKLKSVTGLNNINALTWGQQLLYELSYGTDFLSVELFFRGFLILAFIKYAGKDAILPMACFYCTIHFGKPLGECISSYFGGMILGVIVYHTRSIYGGIIIHLGIAWLMELGGYLGNQ